MSKVYFVARTDVAGDSGEQRVFGAFETEDQAAAFGAVIAAQRPGAFAIFEGVPVLRLERDDAPVRAIPVSQG